MSEILNCKKIETAISRAEKKLITEAKENGLYENFGQKEIRMIRDKFINISDYSNEMNAKRNMLESFSKWCRSVSLSEIKSYPRRGNGGRDA
ncbi:hypothetical protein AAGG74_16430 [Bacillus mexicanus]|uniref:hypothetical protein n=1 Tax=Bacillus mexicanus TaxID=2834415 RepID=UPI003D2463D2